MHVSILARCCVACRKSGQRTMSSARVHRSPSLFLLTSTRRFSIRREGSTNGLSGWRTQFAWVKNGPLRETDNRWILTSSSTKGETNGMTSYSTVCCDANVVVRLHDFASSEYPIALALWERWTRERTRIIAPSLLRYEVANVVYRSSQQQSSSPFPAEAVLRSLESLPIEYIDDLRLHVDAVRLAQEFGLPAAYDAHYLALAEREGVDFYTLDRRLVNATKSRLSFIRYVMDE